MRLSKNEGLNFDVSAILADTSMPASHNGLDSTANGSMKDDLLNMLERISTTGQQLQTELQSAKLKDTSLMLEAELKMNSSLRLSPVKSPPFHCACCNEKKLDATGNVIATRERCEKLQDALLSLEEENMRLNRLLLQSTRMDDGSHESQEDLTRRLSSKELELEKLRNVDNSETLQSQCSKDTNDIEAQLNTLCSSLKEKANELECQNTEYLERIQNLERQLKLQSGEITKEDTYKHRINDLHNLLVAKEREIGKLRDQLSSIAERFHEKDKRTEAVLNRDISKRKEVLLLCQKYEQLRKRMKRLESELSTSQSRLKSSTTQIHELKTTCQRFKEEKVVLKHQLQLLQGLVHLPKRTKDYSGASTLLRDYERLTEKYESLLDLRLQEYEKIKASENRPASKRQNLDTYTKGHRIKENRSSALDVDPMWKREQDFHQYHIGEGVLASVSDHFLPSVQSNVRECHDNIITKNGRHLSQQSYPHIVRDAMTSSTVSFCAQEHVANCDTVRYHNGPHSCVHPLATSTQVNSTKEQAKRYHSFPKNNNPQLWRQENVISASIDTKTIPSSHIQRNSSYDLTIQRPAADCGANSHLLKFWNGVATRCRSRSLSPMRNHEFSAKESELEASISSDAGKSVSFAPSPCHFRSKSASAIDIGTPSKNISHAQAVSPAEVLRKVKSAYQEEYVRNMKGVDLGLSSSDTSLKKSSDSFIQKGVSLHCGEHCRKINQNVHNYIEKFSSVIPGPPKNSRYILTTPSLPKPPSPPKGILKKPKSSDRAYSTPSTASATSRQIIASPILNPQKRPMIMREKDLSCLRVAEADNGNSLAWDESVDIIDVSSTQVQVNDENNSLNSSASRQQETLCADEEHQHHTGKQSSMKNKLSLNDLTTPIQFSKSMKDDDTGSQSSLPSPRDHIGRFEFLQDMQSALKSPSFVFQRKENDEANTTSGSSNGYENPELGLSARQQEYAEKLIEKYTRKY